MLVAAIVLVRQSIVIILVVGKTKSVGDILVHIGFLLLYGIKNFLICDVAFFENLGCKVVLLLEYAKQKMLGVGSALERTCL